MSGRGLTQISRDDIDDGYDALDNITSDGVLTNMVAADGKFVLHLKSVEITEPCIIFNATDGCFGYLKTPMEFEYMMLDTLAASDSVLSWRGKMQETVQGYTGDDHTIALAAFGFENFNEMQRLFRKRRDALYRSCIKRLEAGENAEQLWNEYKKIYYEDMSG